MRKTTILLVSALALAFPQAGLAQSNAGLDAYTESPPNVGGNDGGDSDSGSPSGGSSDTTGTGSSGGSSIVSGGSGSSGFGSSGSGGFGSGGAGGSGSGGSGGGGGAGSIGVPTADLADPNATGGIAAQAGLSLLGSVFGPSDDSSAEPASSDDSGLGIVVPIALVVIALAVIGGLVLRARRTRTGHPGTA